MKVKLNLDKQSIKTFLLEHTEKVVFGVVALCFLLIVYNAIGRDGFDRTPEQLRTAVARAEEHIEREPPETGEDEIEPVNGPTVQHLRDHPIQTAPYETATRWDPAIFDPRGPRDDPALFAVEKLRGSVGSGRFAIKTDGGGAGGAGAARMQGRRWVVLTGMVMYARQVKAYKECFAGAEFEPGLPEAPDYLGFIVERATVDGSEAVEALQWSKRFAFSGKTRKTVLDRWGSTPEEVVDTRFLDDALAFPVGPLDGRDWGPEVAHLDAIPLKGDAKKVISEAPPEEAPGDDDDDIEFFGQEPVARPAASADDEPIDPDAPAEHRLFRFFDFDIEPGKQYRYRVQLVVENPNHEIEGRFLVNEASAKERLVMSDFTAPSDPISVPHDSRVYVVSVKQPRRIKESPTGTVRVQKFVLATGNTVANTFPVSLGKVMNFEAAGGSAPTGGGGFFEEEEQPTGLPTAAVRYDTGAVAIDLRGGETLYGKRDLVAPGEMLVLDRTGNVVWHNEFEDTTAFEATQPKTEDVDQARPGFDPDAEDLGDDPFFGN